jgi:transcriptional regulator with XRE-family HTH domain
MLMKRNRPYPNLKTWRRARRLNQREAAEKLGISQGYYSRLETGFQAPLPKIAKVISDRTGVPLETVLGLS